IIREGRTARQIQNCSAQQAEHRSQERVSDRDFRGLQPVSSAAAVENRPVTSCKGVQRSFNRT
ncbi:MAG TPA: hypothetical protein PL166_14950, partial [Candidatus Contendobacter sp.]|nr:hypothetical protein [Candidatus Contendobacter sp.]